MIKNAGPLRLWAGRLLACFRMLLAPDVCRLLAFLGAGETRRKRAAGVGGAVGGVQGSGVMGCRGWPSVRRLLVVFRGWLCGGDPAVICGGN